MRSAIARKSDLTGERYGSIEVLRRAGETGTHELRWWCKCECGAEFTARSSRIRYGMITSCEKCKRKDRGRTQWR